MFAENGRISMRQFSRLLTMEMFGVTTLLLPGILCTVAGRDGVTALLGGMVLTGLYALLLRAVARNTGKGLQHTLKSYNRLYYEAFLFIMLIQMTFMGVWALTLAAEMSRDILLPQTDIRMMILTFAFVSLLGACKGMECRGRMAEVIYLILLIPFLLLLVLVAEKVEVARFEPLFSTSVPVVARGSYEVFIVFQGVTLGFFALPYLKNQKVFVKGVRRSILLNGMFCLFLFVFAVGIFGVKGAASQKWLAVNLMTTPEFPGALVERLDVLMVTIWMMSLFFFVSGTMFYSGRLAARLFQCRKERCGRLVMAVLITLGAVLAGNKDISYYIYLNYMKYIGAPLLCLILLVIGWRIRPKRVAAMMALLLSVSALSGCTRAVELENREFLLALGVNQTQEGVQFYYGLSDSNSEDEKGRGSQVVQLSADSLYDMESTYAKQSDQYLDCNHLKAVIIGRGLATDREALVTFLRYIEQDEKFARNVRIFVAQDPGDIFSMQEQMDTSLGEYLDNLYVDSSYYNKQQGVTLGELLNHWHEQNEVLMMPLLEQGEKQPAINAYAVFRKQQWVELADNRQAQLFYLANGICAPIEIATGDDCVVRIRNVRRNVEFEGEQSLCARVALHLQGQIISRSVYSQKQAYEKKEEAERLLEKEYQEVLQDWQGMDVLHLYREVGIHDRALWKKYKNREEQFLDGVTISIQVDMEVI